MPFSWFDVQDGEGTSFRTLGQKPEGQQTSKKNCPWRGRWDSQHFAAADVDAQTTILLKSLCSSRTFVPVSKELERTGIHQHPPTEAPAEGCWDLGDSHAFTLRPQSTTELVLRFLAQPSLTLY